MIRAAELISPLVVPRTITKRLLVSAQRLLIASNLLIFNELSVRIHQLQSAS